MTMTIAEYKRRPQRAAEADGLNDLSGGIALLAITLMQYVGMVSRETIRVVPGQKFWENREFQVAHALWILSIVAMFAVIFLSKRAVTVLRERYVYTRLGYAAPLLEPQIRRKWLLMAVGLAIPLLLGGIGKALLEAGKPLPAWPSGALVLIVGVIGGVSYLSHFAKLGFLRHLWLAVICILASLLMAAVPLTDIYRIGWLTIILGVSSIAAGAVTFAALLRTPLYADHDAE